ncbi:hypothetical protein [Streptosporangium vulgare]|uniref:Uncharacterized protein n=1 Tax=Streptosporangium vulgare TaxID=46190 RepID=A0ABV5TL28_9ACTN
MRRRWSGSGEASGYDTEHPGLARAPTRRVPGRPRSAAVSTEPGPDPGLATYPEPEPGPEPGLATDLDPVLGLA